MPSVERAPEVFANIVRLEAWLQLRLPGLPTVLQVVERSTGKNSALFVECRDHHSGPHPQNLGM